MSTLSWRPDFELAQPRMDATHREFVQQLADLEQFSTGRPSAAGAALQALLDHTIAHFAQEERWMASLCFAPDNCHQLQHANVLEVVREVHRRLAAEGDALDPALLIELVQALAQWFPTHALMMDAALAETMAERGFDPDADMAQPPATATTPGRGCGGSG